MKNLIKKNQLMITALAIMLAIAGYLQFAGNNLEDEYLAVDTSVVDNSVVESVSDELSYEEIASLDSEVDIIMDDYLEDDMVTMQLEPEEGEIPGEAVFTSSNGVAVLSEAKLLKEQVRSKNKESLLEIINSDGLSDTQKQSAVNAMVEMTEIAEKEVAAEVLLQAKGFTDVVVSINGDAVDVVVNMTELTEAQLAQIEDIVKRKTETGAENIIISTVSRN